METQSNMDISYGAVARAIKKPLATTPHIHNIIMGDLSGNFSRHEFACRCGCGFDTVDSELLHVLQRLRDFYNKPIIIQSGCRCFAHNLSTPGAARNSLHIEAKAADIHIPGVLPIELYKNLDHQHPHTYGLGLYSNRIHIDVRPIPARWHKTA